MEVFNPNSNIPFLKWRNISVTISVILMLVSIGLIVTRGLHYALDFTGGVMVEVEYEKPVAIADVRSALTKAGFDSAVVQSLGGTRELSIRLPLEALEELTASTKGKADTSETLAQAEQAADGTEAGIAAAKALGWQVLVTDHHLPGATLPMADAIVDPNQPGDAFPSKSLAGVGVMFYVLLALRAKRGIQADLASLLDLVAVGTVADMVALDANNRALVGAGLRRLRAGQGCAGLRALIEVAGRHAANLTTTDIGFAIGPRINAAGRLEDMSIGIECLLSEDPVHAMELAQILQTINRERRGVQAEMQDMAEAQMSGLGDAAASYAVCLYDSDWHPGVVGLVASKTKERLHRPAIAFAPAEPGSSLLRGSARSIPGFHIRDALALVDARHPGLVPRFGGHAMAAGLSLELDDLAAFRDAFQQVACEWLTPDLLTDILYSDGELETDEFAIESALALRDGGHWGQGYPEPLFDGEFNVLGWRIVGERHLKLELMHEGGRLNAIHFGGWNGAPPPGRVRLAFRLAPDDYRGGDAIQLIVAHRESTD